MSEPFDNQARLTQELTRQKDREVARVREEFKEKKITSKGESKAKISKSTANKISKKNVFIFKSPFKKSRQATVVIRAPPSALEPMQRDRSRFFNEAYEIEKKRLFFK